MGTFQNPALSALPCELMRGCDFADNFVTLTRIADNHGTDYDLGAELITNGGFTAWTADNPDGWAVTESAPNLVTQNGNACRIVSDGVALVQIAQGVMTINHEYVVDFDITAISGTLGVRGTSGYVDFTTTGHKNFRIVAPGPSMIVKRNGVCDATFTNFSVKEVVSGSSNSADHGLTSTGAGFVKYDIVKQCTETHEFSVTLSFSASETSTGVLAGNANCISGVAPSINIDGFCVWVDDTGVKANHGNGTIVGTECSVALDYADGAVHRVTYLVDATSGEHSLLVDALTADTQVTTIDEELGATDPIRVCGDGLNNFVGTIYDVRVFRNLLTAGEHAIYIANSLKSFISSAEAIWPCDGWHNKVVVSVEYLADGDCEEITASQWTAENDAILSKQSTDPYRKTRNLRVTYGGTANPYASQSVLESGYKFLLTGAFRGDGSAVPSVYHDSAAIATGTSSASWQLINVVFDATDTDIWFGSQLSGAGYVEFDFLSIRKIFADNLILDKTLNFNDLYKGDGETEGEYPTFTRDRLGQEYYVFDGVDDYISGFPDLPDEYTLTASTITATYPAVQQHNDDTLLADLIVSGAWAGSLFSMILYAKELEPVELYHDEYQQLYWLWRGRAFGAQARIINQGFGQLAVFFDYSINPFQDYSANLISGSDSGITQNGTEGCSWDNANSAVTFSDEAAIRFLDGAIFVYFRNDTFSTGTFVDKGTDYKFKLDTSGSDIVVDLNGSIANLSGTELITNGTFDSDLSDWTDIDTAEISYGGTSEWSGGKMYLHFWAA